MEEDFIRELDYMGMATRLKRISDMMVHSGRQMYKFLNMDIEPNWYLIFRLLEKHGTLSVTEISEKLRFAHPSVISIVKKMKKNNYLDSYTNTEDTRKQQFKLSEKALHKLPELEALWASGREGLKHIFENKSLLDELDRLEGALNKKSFKDRTLEKYFQKNKIRIVSFTKNYANDFAKLNYEWLNEYFVVEEHDKELLDEPEKNIIKKGGHILIALNERNIAIGTVALIKTESDVFELAKMAVTPAYQGYKIGNQLMASALKLGKDLHAQRLFLESNRKLVPAINLYKKFGFVEVSQDVNSPYSRSDIKMELVLSE